MTSVPVSHPETSVLWRWVSVGDGSWNGKGFHWCDGAGEWWRPLSHTVRFTLRSQWPQGLFPQRLLCQFWNHLVRSIVLPGFPGNSEGKESACSAGDLGSIPGLGRFPGEGKGYPLQYLGLENSTDRGAWRATVHGVAESRPQLSDREHTSPSQALEFVLFHQDLDFDMIDSPGPSSPSFLGFFFFWLCWIYVLVQAFSSCREQGLLSSFGAWPSPCSGFSCGA